MRNPGSFSRGYLCVTGILLLALCYIGDLDMIDHGGLVWGRLYPKWSLGHRANNVTIPLDLTQLFCPGFMLAAGLPSSFTADRVSCWGGALWRACNLISFSPCLTGPVDYPFASHREGPRFNPQGGTYLKPGFSCYRCLATYLLLSARSAAEILCKFFTRLNADGGLPVVVGGRGVTNQCQQDFLSLSGKNPLQMQRQLPLME